MSRRTSEGFDPGVTHPTHSSIVFWRVVDIIDVFTQNVTLQCGQIPIRRWFRFACPGGRSTRRRHGSTPGAWEGLYVPALREPSDGSNPHSRRLKLTLRWMKKPSHSPSIEKLCQKPLAAISNLAHAVSFTPLCISLLNEYLAVDTGGYMWIHRIRIGIDRRCVDCMYF